MRGTTPTHEFIIPIDGGGIKDAEITYVQSGNIVLQKYLSDCTVEGGKISATLTQEETFEFAEGANVEIQIRVKMPNGTTFKSRVYTVDVDRCLSDEVL